MDLVTITRLSSSASSGLGHKLSVSLVISWLSRILISLLSSLDGEINSVELFSPFVRFCGAFSPLELSISVGRFLLEIVLLPQFKAQTQINISKSKIR